MGCRCERGRDYKSLVFVPSTDSPRIHVWGGWGGALSSRSVPVAVGARRLGRPYSVERPAALATSRPAASAANLTTSPGLSPSTRAVLCGVSCQRDGVTVAMRGA